MIAPIAIAFSAPARARPTWTVLSLPQSIDAGADGNYDDLRITDDRGEEIPYAIDPPCIAEPQREAALSDVGFVAGRYTQGLLDAGTSGAPYTTVSLATPLGTFFDRVDVAISDDRVTWRTVRTGALIYRVADSGDPGSQTIPIAPARARWIRVRIHDTKAPFPLTAAALDPAEPAPAPPRLLASSQRYIASRDPHDTVLQLDLGTPNTTIAAVRFTTTQVEFSRPVTIETSNDGEHWVTEVSATIQRFANGEPQLDVPAQASQGRYLRAVIDNGDNRPLAHIHAAAYGPIHRLVFIAHPGRWYKLKRIPQAQAPVYDLATLLDHDQPRFFGVARLALREPEPVASPKLTKQLTWLPTLAFGFAITVLLAIVLATLRRTSPM